MKEVTGKSIFKGMNTHLQQSMKMLTWYKSGLKCKAYIVLNVSERVHIDEWLSKYSILPQKESLYTFLALAKSINLWGRFCGSVGEQLPCMQKDTGSIPGSIKGSQIADIALPETFVTCCQSE